VAGGPAKRGGAPRRPEKVLPSVKWFTLGELRTNDCVNGCQVLGNQPSKEEQNMEIELSAERPVKVEVGTGATPPKVALLRSKQPVKVQVGTGATPPKVALLRSKQPVKVQVGTGATPPKVALLRSKQPVKADVGAGATPPKIAVLPLK
jgi:hypothetical protein